MASRNEAEKIDRPEVIQGRPRLEWATVGPSPQLRIRITQTTRDQLTRAAELEKRTISEIARDAFALYLAAKHPDL